MVLENRFNVLVWVNLNIVYLLVCRLTNYTGWMLYYILHLEGSCKLIFSVSRMFWCFRYPQCLYFLELLQYEHFRRELMNQQCAKFIEDQQLLHWQHYQRRRMKLLQEQSEKTASATAVDTAANAATPTTATIQTQPSMK